MHPDIAPPILRTTPRFAVCPATPVDRLEKLYTWDVTRLKAYLTKEGFTDVEEMVTEYLRYMELVVRHPNRRLPMGSPIDPVWHAHILDTRDYAAFCQAINGEFIHHTPNLTEAENVEMATDYNNNTIGLYHHHFGDVPQRWWPHGEACCTGVKCGKC